MASADINRTIKDSVNVIIPAAGWGRRVGSPEAKEMFPRFDSYIDGTEPLIHFPLKEAKKRNFKATIVTRSEKKSLIDHVQTYFPETQIQIIKDSREWPESVLLSQDHWESKNLLFLPDMTFAPVEIIDLLIQDLNSDTGVSVAGFEVEDPSGWGVYDDKNGFAEKPVKLNSQKYWAWGLMAFQKEIGESLFQNLLKSSSDHHFYSVATNVQKRSLNLFKDLTRA